MVIVIRQEVVKWDDKRRIKDLTLYSYPVEMYFDNNQK